MEKFEAKNGLQIEADLGPVVRIWEGSSRDKENNRLRGYSYLNDRDVEALREFFQHERDKELGRWRWPENPEYVVYKAPAGERVPDARHVTVSNESNGEAAWLFEVASGGVSGGLSWAREAARAYFAAHPEPKPLPTEPGSVLQGTGNNRTILHRSYPVNGHESDHPWTALGGATYSDEEVPEFFRGEFIQLVPKEES